MTSFKVLFMASLATGVSFASAFQNGDFASPGGVAITHYLGCGDSFVTGWINDVFAGCTPSPLYPGASTTGEQDYQNGSGAGQIAPANGGTYDVTFGDNDTTGGTLQQTFDTMTGDVYQINYLVSLTDATSPLSPESMLVEVFSGVNLLGSEEDNAFTNTTWVGGPTLTFTATSASTTLIFTDTTGAGLAPEQNWSLDDVTVNSGVPEPSTVSTLFLSCVLLVAALLRNSRRIRGLRPVRWAGR
jgi:hypothetical protein